MKYKILAINLLYNPSGGSLAQIKKIFEHLNEFKFDYFVIYTTPSNLHLIEDLNLHQKSQLMPQFELLTFSIFVERALFDL